MYCKKEGPLLMKKEVKDAFITFNPTFSNFSGETPIKSHFFGTRQLEK